MSNITARSFESRFTVLQLLIATAVLAAIFAAGYFWTIDRPARLIFWALNAYVLFAAIWLPKRVVQALAAELEASDHTNRDGTLALSRVFEAAMLPIYCAALLLIAQEGLVEIFVANNVEWLRSWFGTLSFLGYGISAALVSALTLLLIWRRRHVARWPARLTAQFAGLSIFAAGFFLMPPAAAVADKFDVWYFWPLDPRLAWLGLVFICVLLCALAVMRLWRSSDNANQAPWPVVLFLVLFVGYLAGFGKFAGIWPSSWMFGAFFMARQATYAFYLLEPKDADFTRSGWFVCYLTAAALCVLTTTHQVMTGNFGMTQVFLLAPFPLVGFHGAPWAFSLSLMIFLTRDLLVFLWLNRRYPSKFPDVIGIAVLALIYLILPSVLLALGLGPLLSAIVPLFASGPADFIGPIATIALLVYVIFRSAQRGQT